MKALLQTLISTAVIIILTINALSQNNSILPDIESFKIGDTCVVKMLNTKEIAGVLVQKNSNTIQLADKHVNYTIDINDIVSMEYLHKPGQENPEMTNESQSLETPSYDYSIHLKDRSVVRGDLISLTGDSLLTKVKGSGNRNLCADDINAVVKINKSYSVLAGVIGGFAGLGLGYLISHAIAYSDYQEPAPGAFHFELFQGLRELTVVCGTILGTATGAVIGAIIGAGIGNDDAYSMEMMDKEQKIRELRKILSQK